MYDDAALLAILLEPLKARVLVAQSTDEALEIVDNQAVDLVVTDLNMPGASGLDLARELRSQRNGPAVMFLTASARPEDRISALQLGAVAYLQKPVALKYLIRLAKETLRLRCCARSDAAASASTNTTSGAR